MKHRALPVVLALLIASGAGRSAFHAQQVPQEGLVFVNVLVIDQTASRVPGLAPEDLEVRVDGEARPIAQVTPDDRPVLAVLLLDVSSSCWIQAPDLRLSLERHFLDGLAASDHVRLGLVGAGPSVLTPPLARSGAGLQAALHLLDLPPTYTVATRMVPRPGSLVVVEEQEQRLTGARMGPSPVWDAVYAAASALENEPGRPVILLLTDGRATGNVHGLDETVVRAFTAGASIHVVSEAEDVTIAVDASNAARVRPDVFLEAMANQTGGSYASVVDAIVASGRKRAPTSEEIARHVGALLTRAVQQAHRTYRIGFAPATLDNGVHRLEVRVRRPGVTVRAPAHFVAAPATSAR